jgi:hypothetical protein
MPYAAKLECSWCTWDIMLRWQTRVTAERGQSQHNATGKRN